MSFSSNELNFVIWRYLIESGFNHSAFSFAHESNLSTSAVDSTNIQNGALVQIVQKGLFYTEAEMYAASSSSEVEADKATINHLSLLEAVKVDNHLHKPRPREKPEQPADETTPAKDLQQLQRERDRENRSNLHNGSLKKEVKQFSPRNNGTLGLHAKKQQAAQQAQASSIA